MRILAINATIKLSKIVGFILEKLESFTIINTYRHNYEKLPFYIVTSINTARPTKIYFLVSPFVFQVSMPYLSPYLLISPRLWYVVP